MHPDTLYIHVHTGSAFQMSDASHFNTQLHNAGATPQLQSLACSAFDVAQQRSTHAHTRARTHTYKHIHTRTQVRLFRCLMPPTSTYSCTMQAPRLSSKALLAARLVQRSSVARTHTRAHTHTQIHTYIHAHRSGFSDI